VTNYVGTGINSPFEIAVGPDNALWFTNANKSIGRITTTGVVAHYSRSDILSTIRVVAGSDGAMWFTCNCYNGQLGRITTFVTPTITHITPPSGEVGTQVTITGQNLPGASKVAFNGTVATVVSDTATTIVAIVPAGATTGSISVTTLAGTATSTNIFKVK
jgi:streptogramin lyase